MAVTCACLSALLVHAHAQQHIQQFGLTRGIAIICASWWPPETSAGWQSLCMSLACAGAAPRHGDHAWVAVFIQKSAMSYSRVVAF